MVCYEIQPIYISKDFSGHTGREANNTRKVTTKDFQNALFKSD
jgi:hypothetical protein